MTSSFRISSDQSSKVDDQIVKSRIQVLCDLAKVESEIASVAKAIRGTADSQISGRRKNKNKKSKKILADGLPRKKQKSKHKKSMKNKKTKTVEESLTKPTTKTIKRPNHSSTPSVVVKKRRSESKSASPITSSKRRVYVDSELTSPVTKRRIIVDTKSSIELPE